jgi:hypothetical protein
MEASPSLSPISLHAKSDSFVKLVVGRSIVLKKINRCYQYKLQWHSIKFSFFCNKYLVTYSNHLNSVYHELEIAFFWKENK